MSICGKKPQVSQNNQISSLPVPGHSVPPTEADPLTPAEAVFSHSVTSTEGVFGHSVPPKEADPLASTDRSQMNCASISDTAETPDSSSDRVVGSNNHSLSIADLSLTQDKVESTYADVFQGLGKFPGDPYKLRIKARCSPSEAQTKKSSCTSPRCIP